MIEKLESALINSNHEHSALEQVQDHEWHRLDVVLMESNEDTIRGEPCT